MEGSEFKTSDVVRRSDDHVACDLDGEVLLLSIGNGHYYHMNETASRIWDLIATPQEFDFVCRRLLEEYDVEEATCRREVTRILAEMRAAGLMVVT